MSSLLLPSGARGSEGKTDGYNFVKRAHYIIRLLPGKRRVPLVVTALTTHNRDASSASSVSIPDADYEAAGDAEDCAVRNAPVRRYRVKRPLQSRWQQSSG